MCGVLLCFCMKCGPENVFSFPFLFLMIVCPFSVPYSELKPIEVGMLVLKQGNKLQVQTSARSIHHRPLCQLADSCPPILHAVFRRCVAMKPEDRPTMNWVYQRLRDYIDDVSDVILEDDHESSVPELRATAQVVARQASKKIMRTRRDLKVLLIPTFFFASSSSIRCLISFHKLNTATSLMARKIRQAAPVMLKSKWNLNKRNKVFKQAICSVDLLHVFSSSQQCLSI